VVVPLVLYDELLVTVELGVVLMLPLALICMGGQGTVLRVELTVVCCAPADAASAAPTMIETPAARLRASRRVRAFDIDMIPSSEVIPVLHPRVRWMGGARRSRHVGMPQLELAPRRFAASRSHCEQCACPLVRRRPNLDQESG
jgi:hypothetical protein